MCGKDRLGKPLNVKIDSLVGYSIIDNKESDGIQETLHIQKVLWSKQQTPVIIEK